MNIGTLVVSLIVAVLELAVATGLQVRLVVAMRRKPVFRVLAAYLRDLRAPTWNPRVQAAGLAILLALFQVFPLIREGVLGTPHTPDHISGVGVIAVEVAFGAWLWLGTTYDPPERSGH